MTSFPRRSIKRTGALFTHANPSGNSGARTAAAYGFKFEASTFRGPIVGERNIDLVAAGGVDFE